MISRSQILRRPSNTQLLVVAAAVQLVLTISVYAIGRLGVLQAIDQNGCVTALGPDSASYLSKANSLSNILTEAGPVAWLETASNFHIRLYSLSLAILGPLFGANILSVEPVNLLCYSSILWLTFKLGEEVFDRRAGLLAAVALALWPSFLLHTTQLLKDQVFLALLLVLILIMTRWLNRTFSWLMGVTMGIAGGAAAFIISHTRSGFWGFIVLAIVLTGAGLLLIRQLRERRILVGNIISATLIVLVTSTILLLAPEKLEAEAPLAENFRVGSPPSQNQSERFWLRARADRVAQKLTLVRRDFTILHPESGADIDVDVEFATILDVGWYLPRAAAIGFLAPFPNYWFKVGKVAGSAGRLVSGLEMSAFYLIEILALIGLWRSRSHLRAWLLLLVTLTGVLALTLATANLGALYRLRYGFFIPVIILGAHGLLTLLAHWEQPVKRKEKGPTDLLCQESGPE